MGMGEHFEVGKPYAPAIGLGEGVRFGIDETGCTLMYSFSRPTADEVASMGSGQPFEIRFVTIGGIIWILSKCGNLHWTDAPYNPRLSSGLPDPGSIEDGAGLALTMLMVDASDGVLKSLRLVGLGTGFSRKLAEEAQRVRQAPMTVREAGMSIAKTMQAYPTPQLVKMAAKDRYWL